MPKRTVIIIKAILEASETTSSFLADVQRAIESLYAEDESAPDCPEGFGALDVAIAAFEQAEEQEPEPEPEPDDEES